ncbi:hypothetical protein EHQ23_16705 [Leptospira bourretii]|uniref:Uncharacterized protein n=1 Tax=Leptospira bourretii TaxID=2484962 RepID=A0A4R9IQM4_9LEPT|nr:hypothetical protein EHQ23_16705 [Leptospira bourretii]TGK94318.1 hypothetical protein EHQ26_04525 [Leptospira bourretii]TGL26291.1 hypothetical protein EHQ47_00165 [Leptospira bourretii]TGL28134.1 hypothetical protein EHQ45_16520 [Leptospira bourretii]
MKISRILIASLLLIFFVISCAKEEHKHKEIYTCPMHPQIEMDHPGECPICGMQLVKKEDPLLEPNHTTHSEEDSKGLNLSVGQQSLVNLETISVTKGDITRNINLSGQVVFDPEIFSTVNEYKSVGSGNEWGKEIREGIFLKFAKLGLSDIQIRYILSKNSNLFLTGRFGNTALLVFQVYENDVDHLKVGNFVNVTNATEANFPTKVKIVAIGNLINQETRTLSVWCEVLDPNYQLKPQMYVQGIFGIQKMNVLRIPKESIFPTGKSDLVYLKTGTNQFSPKKIKLGFASSEWAEVTDGLAENDEIVSKANFLLDSESKLKLGGDKNDQHNH